MSARGDRPHARALRAAILGLGVLAASAAPASAIAPGQTLNVVGLSGTLAPLPFTTGNSGLVFTSFSSIAERTVSADGRYVVFVSNADAMTADPGGPPRIYRRDVVTGETIVISRDTAGAPSTGSVQAPSVSDSGNVVAFVTNSRLDPDDPNSSADVYVRNVTAGTTTLVSRAAGSSGVVGNGSSFEPEVSGDGAFVVFTSNASNIHPDDPDSTADVFRRALSGGALRLVSRRDSDDAKSPSGAGAPSVDEDGDTVAFVSTSPLASEADDGGGSDVYVRTITGTTAGETVLASRVTGASGADSNGSASAPSLDGPGSRVAFMSTATNLDAADTDNQQDVYQRNLATDTTAYVSRATGAAGAACDGSCGEPLLQRDGTASVVTFTASNAPGVADGDTRSVRVQRRLTGAFANTVVSRADGASGAIVSASGAGGARTGTTVAFETSDDAAGPDDANDFWQVYLRSGSTSTYVSRPTGVAPFTRGANDSATAEYPGGRTISADGRYVLFSSESDDLLPADLADTSEDHLFRRDLRTGETLLVSRGPGLDGFVIADDGVEQPWAMSPDGRYVVFKTDSEQLATVFGAPVNETQTYRRDLVTGDVTLVSREDGAGGAPAVDGSFGGVAISDDGNRVGFASGSPGLAAGQSNTEDHVFVRDIAGGRTILASRHDGEAGAAFVNTRDDVALSGDGTRVAMATGDDNLDGNPSPDSQQVVVRDLSVSTTTVVSRTQAGVFGDDTSERPSISADGTRVAFASESINLHPDDNDGDDSVFVTDLRTGAVTLASRTPDGANDVEDANDPQLSPDGGHVVYVAETDLAPQDTNGDDDVYVRDLVAGTTTLASTKPDGTALGEDVDFPAISVGGRCVMYSTDAPTVGGGSPASGDFENVVVRALTGECPAPAPPVVVTPTPTPGPIATPTPTPAAVDKVKPVVSKLSLLRSRFRVSSKSTATSAAAKRKPTPAGTAFRFTLSEKATVRFLIEKVLAGRRSGSTCVKPTKKLARKRKCDRFAKGSTITRRSLAAGKRSVAFSGRIGKKKLSAGRYRLTVTATDAAGNRSAVARKTFTVVSR